MQNSLAKLKARINTQEVNLLQLETVSYLKCLLTKTERKALGFLLCFYNTIILWLEISFYFEKCLCADLDQVIMIQADKM